MSKIIGKVKKTAFGQLCSAYYKEFIYYMHTPASKNLKFGIFVLWVYGISVVCLGNQQKMAEVYKRKRMRSMDIQRSNMPPKTKE
jgi:hypothetical protein